MLKVLLVEDNAVDADLLREMFHREPSHSFELTHVTCIAEAVAQLARVPADIVLLDLQLPDSRGSDTVRRVRAIASDVPIVVLTGLEDETLAAEAIKEGAQDYLIKGQIENRALPRALRYVMERYRMQQEAALAARSVVARMSHLAQHDFLTGLPNRLLLNDRITQAIAQARRYEHRLALLFLDVDHFKEINDSLGHAIGDRLLQSIAERLVACVRRSDTVSRQGGDEFVVLLTQIAQKQDAAVIAAKLLTALDRPHRIAEHELHTTASIGIGIFPDDAADVQTLIKSADTAMYAAKERGGRNHQFFAPRLTKQSAKRRDLERSLHAALLRKEFLLHFQPKVDLQSGAVMAVEALLRWQHPEHGLLPSARFITAAEDCGLIVPIGRWVLREACRQARAWLDDGLGALPMAVNISPLELRSGDFLEETRNVLHETKLPPEQLELELKESGLLQNTEFIAVTLGALKEWGVQLALDDFGTGQSSLSCLHRFPIDILKIDASFVRELHRGHKEAARVSAVIAMGKSLKMRVVAEGIETRQQLAFLQAEYCDHGQGYYFGQPLAAEDCGRMLRAPTARTGPQSRSDRTVS